MTSPDKPSDAGCPELQPAFVEALSTAEFSADAASTSTTRDLADRIAAPAATAQPDEWEAFRLELTALIPEEPPRQVTRGENHSSKPNPHAAFIDWLSFTFPWHISNGDKFRALDLEFRQAFGFGLGKDRGQGHLNYDKSWEIGDGYGIFATGGHSTGGTSWFSLSGQGCCTVKSWGDVHLLLGRLKAKITRIDLAHDDYEGIHDVELAIRFHLSRQFAGGKGRPPKGRLIDDFDSGEGKTLYVGSGKNGKLMRVYEKGKQLGDVASKWVRWELELKNKDRVLEHQILLEPGRYLAGSYPCMSWVSTKQSRIKTMQKTAEIGLDSLTGHCRNSYGKFIWVLHNVLDHTPEQIVEALQVEGYPERLDFPVVGESQP